MLIKLRFITNIKYCRVGNRIMLKLLISDLILHLVTLLNWILCIATFICYFWHTTLLQSITHMIYEAVVDKTIEIGDAFYSLCKSVVSHTTEYFKSQQILIPAYSMYRILFRDITVNENWQRFYGCGGF